MRQLTWFTGQRNAPFSCLSCYKVRREGPVQVQMQLHLIINAELFCIILVILQILTVFGSAPH
jgi:hypothetical protein